MPPEPDAAVGEPAEIVAVPERPPWRPTAIVAMLVILSIVWFSYHYTGRMFAVGLELLTTTQDPGVVKDAVIQLLSAVAQNMVGVAAVTGLVGSVTKLCER